MFQAFDAGDGDTIYTLVKVIHEAAVELAAATDLPTTVCKPDSVLGTCPFTDTTCMEGCRAD